MRASEASELENFDILQFQNWSFNCSYIFRFGNKWGRIGRNCWQLLAATLGEWHNDSMRASEASKLENFDILQSQNWGL